MDVSISTDRTARIYINMSMPEVADLIDQIEVLVGDYEGNFDLGKILILHGKLLDWYMRV